MSLLSKSTERKVLLRSLSVQGSWNYETLIGTGFAYLLIPALREVYGKDSSELHQAVLRHAELFNSHPYLTTLAGGAIAKLEADGSEPAIIERFKTALRGSLGALGDQLVWGAWRPAAVLFGVVLLLVGAPWWLAISAFLLLYNVLHLWLRVWGLRQGTEAGADVGRRLREAPFQEIGARAADFGAVMAGLAVVLAAAPARIDPWQGSAVVLAIAAGLRFGLWTRRIMLGVLAIAWGAAILLGIMANGT